MTVLAPFFACRVATAKASFQDGTSKASAELLRGFSNIAAATATFSDCIGDFKGMTRRASAAASTSAGTPADSRRKAGCRWENSQKPCRLGVPWSSAGRGAGQWRGASPRRRPNADSGDLDMGKVVHAGPAKMLVAPQKAGGFDNRGGEPKTGAHPQYRARVLRDLWLIERHRQRRGPVGLHGYCRGLSK